ncbi:MULTISPECIES: preprotein translocase subunit SecE [unclassified Pseudactinotalea]|uniref:preprotein translocase subunit SecE n=1 Tax=unclassified Pseudactinotalea TaxID=2649176 RepID=UPI00128D4E99|nr:MULTISPECIES: preprotein translocase subunit SecE [unclassified Pseudactinotalea]MPV50963.1 preprotein translocase subunit SecE [Pseudactinotalea sp. HY160]QGH70443.1 preprotein translocase subunit SecE [Pseudactinotalea sp. HY158]
MSMSVNASDGGADGISRAKTPSSKARKPASKPNLFARILTFFKQVVTELKKVVTPSRNEWGTYIIVVLVFVIAVMAYVGVLDFLFGKLMFWAFAR